MEGMWIPPDVGEDVDAPVRTNRLGDVVAIDLKVRAERPGDRGGKDGRGDEVLRLPGVYDYDVPG